jgi:hypothetical protein
MSISSSLNYVPRALQAGRGGQRARWAGSANHHQSKFAFDI